MTITSSVFYPRTATSTFDMAYYIEKHMPLVQKQWAAHGLVSWQVLSFDKDLAGGEAHISVQAILVWEDEARARRAVDANYDEAKVVFGDVKVFSSEGPTFVWGRNEGASK